MSSPQVVPGLQTLIESQRKDWEADHPDCPVISEKVSEKGSDTECNGDTNGTPPRRAR